jgi:hypothetical protein
MGIYREAAELLGMTEGAEMESGTCPNCGTSYVVTEPGPVDVVAEWIAQSDSRLVYLEQATRDINARLIDLQKSMRSLTETLTEFTPLARRAAKLFDNSRVIKIREALNGKGSIKRPNS